MIISTIIGFSAGIYVGVKYTNKVNKILDKLPQLPPYIRLIKHDDKYYVRKGRFGFYEYKDTSNGYWWNKDDRVRYAAFTNYDKAKKMYDFVNESKENLSEEILE